MYVEAWLYRPETRIPEQFQLFLTYVRREIPVTAMSVRDMEKALAECMKVGGDAINLENMQRNYVSSCQRGSQPLTVHTSHTQGPNRALASANHSSTVASYMNYYQ